jgi:hypothetical protein
LQRLGQLCARQRTLLKNRKQRYPCTVNDPKITGVTYKIGKSPSHPHWDCMQVIPERNGRPAESFLIGRTPDGSFYLLTDALFDSWEHVEDEHDVNNCRKLFEDRDKAAAELRAKTADQSSLFPNSPDQDQRCPSLANLNQARATPNKIQVLPQARVRGKSQVVTSSDFLVTAPSTPNR